MNSAQLRWTGHALIDVGVAGVCAYTGRKSPKRPEDVTLEDLDKVSEFIQANYFSGALDSYLSMVFMNSGYCGPNKVDDPEEYADVFRAHRVAPRSNLAAARGVVCAFSGLPATAWVHRQHLPLFSADGVTNYRPNGQVAVPIASAFLVALQFLPMAARKAEGGMLLVHSEDQELILRFARKFLEDNGRILAVASTRNRVVDEDLPRERLIYDKQKKKYKTPEVKGPRSLVIADLTEIGTEASDFLGQTSPLSVYILSNLGTKPLLDTFDVPSGVVTFVLKASGASTRSAWAAVARRFGPVQRAKDEPARKPGTEKQVVPKVAGRAGWSKNPAFEHLCAIYEGGFLDRKKGRAWLSRYVLGRMKFDATGDRFEKTSARTWALAELFLKEVLGMNKDRIAAVRQFGDKIAGWISEQRAGDGKKLLYSVLREKPSELRRKLVRALARNPERKPFFSLDEFCLVWLDDDRDAWLVQDLLAIRVIERLHEVGHYQDVASDLPAEIDSASDLPNPDLEESFT